LCAGKPVPTPRKALTADFNRVILSYGTPLGESQMKEPTARIPIKIRARQCFRRSIRPKNDGFVFFVHTKFLLIDPL
jgi:hypothetical protein